MDINNIVFVGFNSRVAALHRDNGQLLWEWKSPRGSGYVAVLLDGDRLIVSVCGYTYCLNPLTGEVLWFNELSGFGTGAPSLVSVRGSTLGSLLDYAATDDAQRAAAASANHPV